MKKLMIALAAVALAGAANAEIFTSVTMSVYADKDTSPSAENAQAWYSAYAMTLSDAQTMSGVTGWEAITKWLGNNFAVNSATVKNSLAATSTSFDSYGDALADNWVVNYRFSGQGYDEFEDETDTIAFCFFDNGTDEVYKVIGTSAQYYFSLEDSCYGESAHWNSDYSSGWIAVSNDVPEPTSGLLMLVGMAGLALRRRRA